MLTWAADSWHVLQARAVVLGVTGRVGGPRSLLGLEADLFVAFLEGVVRENSALAEFLDSLYSEAIAEAMPPAPVDRAHRRAEINAAMTAFGA